MSALLENNEKYQAVTIMRVDWDKFRKDPITKKLKIPRRSVLVMFKNGKEIDRVIARTSTRDIESLFQKAIDT